MSSQEQEAYLAKTRAASAENRQHMMNQLQLPNPPPLPPPDEDPKRPASVAQLTGSSNWYDEKGYLYVRSEWGNWTNYSEAKAQGYTLPDPLELKSGRRVKNARTWWRKRRPEILADFQTEIYGKIPANTPAVRFEVTSTDPNALGGKAILKKITGNIDNSRFPSDTPRIDLSLYLPAGATGPVPVVVQVSGGLNFAPPGTANQGPTPMEQVLALGWGFATFNTSALQADKGAGLRQGIIGLVAEGKPRRPNDWGVLAAWSWGLSRALDYLETDPQVDAKKVGLQGHSRWGKTALVAAAYDPRWAIVFSSCSGAMGASLEKRNFGEIIDNVAGVSEYHWMAGNFLKYGGNWEALPVDAHQLIALVAPRPVFITGGTKDLWSDPHGEFLACVAAEPVYRLLGKKGLGTIQMPAPDVALTEGELAFRNHEGGHTDAPDWPVFLQFAQRYFQTGAAKAKVTLP